MNKLTKIYIAGHRGMVGSAVCRALESKGYFNLIGKTITELDLRNQQAVNDFFKHEKPDVVIDISKQMELKMRAVKAYKTQFYNPESNESSTIISTSDFLESVRYRAKDLGRESRCQYAEGFISNQLLKVDSLFDVK